MSGPRRISFGPRQEYRLSGSGGQGLQLAAVILAEAATASGKEVVQTQSYGPEARGGASRSEVIISDWPIDFPELESPDVTLCLSQPAWESFAAGTRRGGLVVYESELVTAAAIDGVASYGALFTAIARREAGTPLAANVVSLAALAQISGALPREALEEALRARLPERLLEANLKAFAAGWEAARAGSDGASGD